jgi:hypothetical protein
LFYDLTELNFCLILEHGNPVQGDTKADIFCYQKCPDLIRPKRSYFLRNMRLTRSLSASLPDLQKSFMRISKNFRGNYLRENLLREDKNLQLKADELHLQPEPGEQ